MGIPFYFRTITNAHPSLIEERPRAVRDDGVHGLYLDLNCAIHQCASTAIGRGGSVDVEAAIIDDTIGYIKKISTYVRPSAELFIAIDGPPPRAKMSQQRKRRFVGAWSGDLLRRASGAAASCQQWDRNAITPGTRFMRALADAIQAYLSDWKRSHPGVTVTFLDSDVPGEGETKIFHRLKTQRAEGSRARKGVDVVYGLDADLIMLSLIAHADGAPRRIYLLREPAEYGRKRSEDTGHRQRVAPALPFLYFDVAALGDALARDIQIPIRDYVALCFLLGNDFLPPMSYLKISNDGIDALVAHYRNVRRVHFQNEGTLVDVSETGEDEDRKGVRLNYPFLLKLMDRLKNEEDRAFAEADAAYYDRVPRRKIPASVEVASRDPTAMSVWLDNYPCANKFPKSLVRPNTMGWRPRYYFHLFNGMTEAKDVEAVCVNYLEGLQWTFDYYFKFESDAVAWGWYYKHEYSPTALDMYNHIATTLHATGTDSLGDKLRDAVRDRGNYSPFDPNAADATQLQLLMVLPPSSFHLLPSQLRPIAFDAALGCKCLYPRGFRLTTYLKAFLWECHPVLPPINMDALRFTMQRLSPGSYMAAMSIGRAK